MSPFEPVLESHAFSDTRAARRAKDQRNAEARAKAKADWDAYCRETFERNQAAKAAEAEARRIAEAEAREARRAAMTPLELEIEDHVEATIAGWRAEAAAEREAARKRPAEPPRPKEPAVSADYAAAIESAQAEKARIDEQVEKAKADVAARVSRLLEDAAPDRVSQAKAKLAAAEVESAEAGNLARGEDMARKAAERLDAIRIEAATAAKARAFAVESAKARVAEAAAEVDPLIVGNPYAEVRPRITMAQFNSLSPEKQMVAAREAEIIDDPAPPPLSVAETRSLVGAGRRVVTRAELDSMPLADHSAFFAGGGLVVD